MELYSGAHLCVAIKGRSSGEIRSAESWGSCSSSEGGTRKGRCVGDGDGDGAVPVAMFGVWTR